MHIQTIRQTYYSYLQRTNEIVVGEVEDNDYTWIFESCKRFNAMPYVDMFIIGITEQCNLRCSYCCYSGAYPNNRTHSTLSITEEDLDKIFAFIKKIVSDRPVRIAFYGGEPLTCFSLIKSAVRKAISMLGEDTTFSISTNGTLLTKEMIAWMRMYEIELFISIDGTVSFHDKNRKYLNGEGTFQKIHDVIKYISHEYPDYKLLLYITMTLPSISDLEQIAIEWNEDAILCNISPTVISGLAPNFSQGVEKTEWNGMKDLHLHLLDVYEQHPEYLVLKTYFNQRIAYWKNRSIVEVDDAIPMATCLPLNAKLYIDSKLSVGVCEKISDKCRIGSVKDGIDWDRANELVEQYYTKRTIRCAHCPAIRMCDLCLTAVEYDDEQWNTLCYNEQMAVRLNFLLFCEMAERGMIKQKAFPTLVSDKHKLELTEISEDDALMLREVMDNPECKHFLPDMYKPSRSRFGIERFIESFRTFLNENEGVLWGIKKHDTLIGFVATMDLSTNPTIFFAMHPKYRNQGYMQDSVRLATQYVYDAKLANELHTEVDAKNLASQKVLERCGYIKSDVKSDVTIKYQRLWDI